MKSSPEDTGAVSTTIRLPPKSSAQARLAMAEHPAFTLAGLRKSKSVVCRPCRTKELVAIGGTAGYLRTNSRPSLIAGLGLGTSYALAGKHQLPL